jgi:hypothetical protein
MRTGTSWNWDSRQFLSDNVTGANRKFREKQKGRGGEQDGTFPNVPDDYGHKDGNVPRNDEGTKQNVLDTDTEAR